MFHMSIHVALLQLGHVLHLSSLPEWPSKHSGTSCPNHLRHWTACTLLIASSLLWYMRLWLSNIRLIDGTLPILTSASVDRVSSHQQGWKDDKLCLDAPFDTAPNCLANVMITLSLLHNHHYMVQLSITEPSSTFEHYKNKTKWEQKNGGHCEISFLLSVCVCVCVCI